MRQRVVCIKNLDLFQETIARYEKEGWVISTPVTRSVKQGTFRHYCVTLRISEGRWALMRFTAVFTLLKWYVNTRWKYRNAHVEFPRLSRIFAVDPLIIKI